MSENLTKNRIFLSPPHMGGEEIRFIKEAFESNYIAPLGPMVDAFEREFAEKVGIPYAAAVSSGTAAMHLALRVLAVISDMENCMKQESVVSLFYNFIECFGVRP